MTTRTGEREPLVVGQGVPAWELAQVHEAEWWGSCANTLEEELKQLFYAERMGLPVYWRAINMGGRSVLDVGGGPASLLLKCCNLGYAKVVDPCQWPAWVAARYRDAGIEYQRLPAEEMSESGWDEVWLYNVLQHVRDPEQVVARARKAGKVLRIYEWLEIPADEMHPHTLHMDKLDAWLGARGTVEIVETDICHGRAYYGAFDQE